MLFLNGIPFFFMELAIGQWFSAGVIGVWKSVCPLMKGKRDSRSYKKRRPQAVVILSSEPRAAGEKVKLCKLEVKNEERLSGEKLFPYLGLHPRSSWLRRTPVERFRDLLWIKKKSKRLLGVLNKKKNVARLYRPIAGQSMIERRVVTYQKLMFYQNMSDSLSDLPYYMVWLIDRIP